MEELLIKMARQLDNIDEASLQSLWEKYAKIVNSFEPTKRWEEAVLILSFIQAKTWKNQLFNTQWAMRTKAPSHVRLELSGTSIAFSGMMEELTNKKIPAKRATILQFSDKDTQ